MERANRQMESMMAAARERLRRHTPEQVAERAGTAWQDRMLTLETLGRTVTIRTADWTVTPQLSPWHTLALLHYLDLADGTPPSGRMVPFSQHRDGLVRGGGMDRSAEEVIRRSLGVLPPEELARRCGRLGAEIVPSNADFCARFSFAPRCPLWLKIWFADEELPPSGRLLLDASAPHGLTIEDAVTVGSLILDELTGAKQWNREEQQ